MNTYFVDTNIFLRVLTGEIEKQKDECVFFLKEAQNKTFYVVTSSLVLAEVAWTLLSFYKFPRERVSMAVRSIINLKFLKIVDESQPHVALDLFDKFKVKFVDSLIASTPSLVNKRWTLVSYDKEFDKIGITRSEPSFICSI